MTLVEGDGPSRYRMLETVREYGEARLDAIGGRDQAMAGLVGWAREQAVALAGRFIGPGQVEALHRCAAEQDNLVAGLRWAMGADDEPAAVDVATALFHLWSVRVCTWRSSPGRAGCCTSTTRNDGCGRRSCRRGQRPTTAQRRPAGLDVRGDQRERRRQRRPAARRARPAGAANAAGRTARRVSSRLTALASSLHGFDLSDLERNLKSANEMIAHPDPYVQGLGLFARGGTGERRPARRLDH
ncbi:hypothetical protein NKG94_14570 [Micromonospora sp. M12]